MEKDAIVKIVFYATERANVKTDDIRSDTLMPRENSSLFIVGKLEKTDKTPQGKRDDISLREKEKLILKDLDDEDCSTRRGNDRSGTGKKISLAENRSTPQYRKANYKFVVNIIKKEDFGKKRIDKVKLSER